MTFRKRLILYFSGLLAIFIVVFCVLVFTVLDSALLQNVDRLLEETATLVINNSRGLSLSQEGSRRVIVLPRLDIFSFPRRRCAGVVRRPRAAAAGGFLQQHRRPGVAAGRERAGCGYAGLRQRDAEWP